MADPSSSTSENRLPVIDQGHITPEGHRIVTLAVSDGLAADLIASLPPRSVSLHAEVDTDGA